MSERGLLFAGIVLVVGVVLVVLAAGWSVARFYDCQNRGGMFVQGQCIKVEKI